MNRNFGRAPLDSQIKSHIESNIGTKTIFVLSKIKCGACVQAKALLHKLSSKTGVKPIVFDLDNYPKQLVKAIIKWLSAKTGIKTVPQIFINGKFVGGNDDVQRLHSEGRLLSLIGKKTWRTKDLKVGSLRINHGTSIVDVSPLKIEAATKPTLLDYNSDNLNRRMSASSRSSIGSSCSCVESSRSSMSYRPVPYIIEDDNKWNMPLQFSQSQNLILEERPSLQRANSFSFSANTRTNSNMHVSSPNWILPVTERSVLSREEVSFGNVSFDGSIPDGHWVTVQTSGSRKNERPNEVLVSRYI